MAMGCSAARRVVRGSGVPHAQRSKAKRQRHRAARLRTPAPERIVRTRAFPESATSWLTPMVLVTVLGGVAAVATIVVPLQGAIKEGIQTLETKQTASSIALDAKLTNISSALQVELVKLEASNSVLKTEVATNTASSRELKSEVNTKLDIVSANLQHSKFRQQN